MDNLTDSLVTYREEFIDEVGEDCFNSYVGLLSCMSNQSCDDFPATDTDEACENAANNVEDDCPI